MLSGITALLNKIKFKDLKDFKDPKDPKDLKDPKKPQQSSLLHE